MRDLKTLLELLLENWELGRNNKINTRPSLCVLVYDMADELIVNEKEMNSLIDLIEKYLEETHYYLFPRHAHNERVEWLKERIKELEK